MQNLNSYFSINFFTSFSVANKYICISLFKIRIRTLQLQIDMQKNISSYKVNLQASSYSYKTSHLDQAV